MQSERLIAQVYHHLPTPTQKDFEEFASLNPKLGTVVIVNCSSQNYESSWQFSASWLWLSVVRE